MIIALCCLRRYIAIVACGAFYLKVYSAEQIFFISPQEWLIAGKGRVSMSDLVECLSGGSVLGGESH